MDIRSDLAEAQATAWREIGRPGTWWTGPERVAIAAEVRHAPGCALCTARKLALSPNAVGGDHSAITDLPAAAIEAVHRAATDSGRLGEGWYRGLGLDDERYVELIGVLAVVVAVDTFRRAAGLALWPLPVAEAGIRGTQRTLA